MNNTDQLEKQLAETLARRAEQVTINPNAWDEFQRRNAVAREVSVPQKARRRAPLFAAAAAVIAVGGTALSSTSLFSDPAYASWASSPDSVSAAQVHAAMSKCGTRSALSIDRRGHNTYVLSQDAGRWNSCVVTLPGQSSEGLGSTYISSTPKSASNTQIPSVQEPLVIVDVKVPEGNHVKGEAAPFSYVSGRVDSTVKRVTISAKTCLITATVKDGYFSAWWPGNDTDTAIVRAYGSDGHQVAQVGNLGRSRR